ncbi:GNAT family N-acetyltransferase [Alteromonas sp. KUL49]|uniref:GNAT family N-acetyltransferase n=1 Tax=Alteromonas sp. KUL49 TaxID=2480798 RepID=UPI00102F192C|nr:GNAT family N-acetyltransferase [Alteromonas sp. KUL49]TAP35862.1 GNAT family N-acetyltransferase [Alteromonas sp. KUL49]GEA13243.1 hypothetical protein KUL49_36180 [Alteromonas sp. KUL49]
MLTYREANLSDIDMLKTLEQCVIEAERPFNESIKTEGAFYYDLVDLITQERSAVMVGESEGKIVATGYIQIRASKPSLDHDEHGYLGFMYVKPEFRGQGINKIMLESLINWGNAKGISDFYLDVYAENASAISAYEKAGFTSSIIEMKLNTSD